MASSTSMTFVHYGSSIKEVSCNETKLATYKKNIKNEFKSMDDSLTKMKGYYKSLRDAATGQVKVTMDQAVDALGKVATANSNWNKELESKINTVVQDYANSIYGSILDELAQAATDLSGLK